MVDYTKSNEYIDGELAASVLDWTSFQKVKSGEETIMLKPMMVNRVAVLLSLILTLTVLSARLSADSGVCGGQMITLPFTDVAGNPFFCQIASAFFTGLTNGTTATTYSPGDVVNREQMAAFITRTLDQSLRRGSRRAALGQWWTTKTPNNLGLKTFPLDAIP